MRRALVPICINMATYFLCLIRAPRLPSHLRTMRGYGEKKPVRHQALETGEGCAGESREKIYAAIL
jgi:hypothetical protein